MEQKPETPAAVPVTEDRTIALHLTTAQARAVSQALDLFTRMGLGQMGAIANLARRGVIPFSADGPHSQADDRMNALDAFDDLCGALSRQLGFRASASYGLGNVGVPMQARRAYEVNKVLDKALAEQRDPNPAFRGSDYDGLYVRYTKDMEPVAVALSS
jgi:hypothetical protein